MSRFGKFTFSGIFRESDGSESFGRCAFGFVIFVSISLITYLLLRNKPVNLSEWGWFIMSVGSVTYATNKVAAIWGDRQIATGGVTIDPPDPPAPTPAPAAPAQTTTAAPAPPAVQQDQMANR